MASKKTITVDNLAALGVDRLAAILVELADDNADVKRHLRLELAAQMGGAAAVAYNESLKLDLGGFQLAFSPTSRTGSEFVDLTMISKNGKFIR